MKTKYKYIYFDQTTIIDFWVCRNVRDKAELGLIRPCKQWKCFVFEPEADCQFSPDCLADILDFMKQLEKGVQ